MGQQIIDLDEVLGDDKRVRLGGKTYTLPPDIPTELYLQINKAAGEGKALEPENVEKLQAGLLELFQYGDPKLTKLPSMSLAQLFAAIPRIYGATSKDDGEDDAAPPPARPTRGGASTKSRTRTRSR
jgi:hypothetical protein